MKEKIFNKMIEYGWHLENWNDIYKYHYNNIESWYNFLVDTDYDFNMEEISKDKFTDMVDFMSDFLRAINDIDNKEIVGNKKIILSNKHDIPLSLGYLTINDSGEIECKIRNCYFNGGDLIDLLNNNKDMVYKNWSIQVDTDNMIILKGQDNSNLVYLTIERK